MNMSFNRGGGPFADENRAPPATPAAPEPSTWAMLRIGFAGVGLAGRRALRERRGRRGLKGPRQFGGLLL
jgi:hypothetical protein